MSVRERERAILIGKTFYDRYNMYASSLQSFHAAESWLLLAEIAPGNC